MSDLMVSRSKSISDSVFMMFVILKIDFLMNFTLDQFKVTADKVSVELWQRLIGFV